MRVAYSLDINGTATTPAVDFDLMNIRGQAINWTILYATTSGTHSTQAQVSADGVTWVNVGTALTSNGVTARTEKGMYFRFVIAGTSPVGKVQVII